MKQLHHVKKFYANWRERPFPFPLLLLFLITLPLLAACGGNQLAYRVTGAADQAKVTYADSDGASQTETVALPWETSFDVGNSAEFSLIADNATGQGDISCAVLLNEEELGRADATYYASCQGSFKKSGGSQSVHFSSNADVLPDGNAAGPQATDTPILPTATATAVPPTATPIPPTPTPSPTPDIAADFETYSDDAGQVSFRYPADWEIETDDTFIIAASDIDSLYAEDYSQSFGFFVGEINRGDDDPAHILDVEITNFDMQMEPTGELEATESDGIRQVKQDYAANEDGQTLLMTVMVIVNGNRNGVFFAGTTPAGAEEYGEIVTAVLDSVEVSYLDPDEPEAHVPDSQFEGEMALVMKVDGQYNLVRMDMATGIIGRSIKENAVQPAWIPGADDLSFSRCENDSCAIYAAASARPLVAEEGVKFQNSSWSTDGHKMVFDANANGLDSPGGLFNLYVYDFATDPPTLTQLTSDAGNNGAPVWSVGGLFIVFTSDRDGDYDIYFMRADGTDPLPITHNDAKDIGPAVSPDSEKVAYISDAGGEYAVYVFDFNSGETLQLTDSDVAHYSPTWSPDGRYIAYLTLEGEDRLQIYITAADGSGEPIKYSQRPAGLITAIEWKPAERETAVETAVGTVVGTIIVDFTDPASVLQAVFDSARLSDYSQLAGLCDPQGENDSDTALICEITAGHTNEDDFIEYFGQGHINGEVVINGDRAELPFLFGPDGDQEETMIFILRDGQWYLFEL